MNLDERIAEIDAMAGDLRRSLDAAITEAQESAEDLVYGPENDLQGTANSMVDLLEVIKAHKAVMRDVDNQANPTLVSIMDHMGTRKFERGGLVVEKKQSSYRSNWQNNVLIRSVVNTAMDEIADREYVDQETGEPISERSILAPWIEAIVERLLECAAFRDWRVTALRARVPGLDPDNFCDVKRSSKATISKAKN
jgi:hypothetical protein